MANQPHIQIYQYLAYNGGFAKERTLLWNCDVIGVNGERRNWKQDGWAGHEDKQYAVKRATDASIFTGWPIVEAGRVEALDQPPKKHY